MIGLQERWEHPALLVVDMQNDFVRTGAPLEVPDARATIAVQKTLIDHLSRAAVAGRDIFIDQKYRHSLTIRDLVEEIKQST